MVLHCIMPNVNPLSATRLPARLETLQIFWDWVLCGRGRSMVKGWGALGCLLSLQEMVLWFESFMTARSAGGTPTPLGPAPPPVPTYS